LLALSFVRIGRIFARLKQKMADGVGFTRFRHSANRIATKVDHDPKRIGGRGPNEKMASRTGKVVIIIVVVVVVKRSRAKENRSLFTEDFSSIRHLASRVALSTTMT
jgi:hypothetical protein